MPHTRDFADTFALTAVDREVLKRAGTVALTISTLQVLQSWEQAQPARSQVRRSPMNGALRCMLCLRQRLPLEFAE